MAPKQLLQKSPKAKERPAWLKLPDCIGIEAKGPSQTGARLTACLITKNEEEFLAQCLESVKNLAHQIVVVDTGSTDRTVEIAKSFGAEVFHFDWCDDFAAARNAALEHARGDWVLILDADEELPSDQHARLAADLKNQKTIALRLPLINRGQEAEGRSYVPRLFRNAPGVFYSGRIHEQVFPSLIGIGKPFGLSTGLGTAQIRHHGYSQQTVADRNKVQRNLKLLRLAVEECPEDANLAMNLGLELARSGELSAGLAEYRRAFQLMANKPAAETAPELCEALLTQFTSHLYKARAHQEAVEVLNSSLARQNGLTASLHFALGLACYELGRYSEAVQQMRQCLAKRQQPALTPINTDILTAAPYHCLAMSLAKVGDAVAADKAFQDGLQESDRRQEFKLDYARFLAQQNRHLDALHRLHELVTQHAHCSAAWRLGGQIALSGPDFLEFACDWTGEAVRQLPDDDAIASQRAEALLLSQQTGPACELWRTVWQKARDPRSLAALILCEIVEDRNLSGLELTETQLGPTNRALIDWYQRCLAMRAQNVLDGLNHRLERLGALLPAAAGMIEAALSDARAESNIPEPCLA
jgi:tetratricopeptide (TPR) repeat protein